MASSGEQQLQSSSRSNNVQESNEYDNQDDEDDDDDDEGEVMSKKQQQPQTKGKKPPSKWDQLNPNVKQRIVKAAQERAIANKKKREPEQDKKRRLLMFVKQKQQEKKKSGRIERPLPFDQRTPLSALIPGMEMRGLVISLTKFGAYVDVGTECDGLLHISQLSRDTFVEHPRQMLTPGQEIMVRVRSCSSSAPTKKLQLTMLPPAIVEAEQQQYQQAQQQQQQQPAEGNDRIPLTDIFVDDELWGELRRVTDYGAYVELGAVVDGWLHFMDHPLWERGRHPSTFMQVGDRVRVWVSDVDPERQRVKLTANRPPHLPGPRREFARGNY
ncbi:hypothetical protein ACA910_012116 [Epithemia clementina (nom. ined.)]